MDPYIGKLLDNRYEILERIGTGGMAVVYKAKCHRLNRLVAVKILKSDLAQDADFRRRFNAESQAVAQLSHANIVNVYDVSREGDIKYIVMELVDGITLKQYMEKRGQLNWRESLHFITQIMRGLSHAHSKGIVHRDIKPQNIMVLRDGSVKVADFGIACLENANQTLTQEALGSVHYISPEQARGDRIDARSDIYSAGVVLYEMLAGRLPFEGESAVSVAIQHLSSIPLAPREINPDIPEQLELICMKAMASDIDRRYCSAEEMIADLEAFRKDPSVDLDIAITDIRPEETDEPTQFVRTASVSRAVNAQTRHTPEHRERVVEEAPSGGGKHTALILGIVAAVVVVILVVLHSIMTSFKTPASVQSRVPALYDLTVEEAMARDDIRDIFEIVVKGDPIPSEHPVGTIARQDPLPDEIRKGDNRVIKVWISAGEEVDEMPDLVGTHTVASAKIQMKDLIEKYDLTLDYSAEYDQFSDKIEKDYIMETQPKKGEPLEKGQTIKLIVSKGEELKKVQVPQFVGRNLYDVLDELKTVWKLTCVEANVEMVDSDAPGGEIIWQSLEKGASVDEWTDIQFKVSSGLADYVVDDNFALPQDGRETVQVEVFVGDETTPQYSERLKCSDGMAYVRLRGSGTQQVKVYFDGVLEQEYTHDVTFDPVSR